MACFSCSENKDINTVTILQMYKDAYIRTGKIYWFFKELSNNDIKIMPDEDFTKFREKNKRKFAAGKFEFARIDEFRIAQDN